MVSGMMNSCNQSALICRTHKMSKSYHGHRHNPVVKPPLTPEHWQTRNHSQEIHQHSYYPHDQAGMRPNLRLIAERRSQQFLKKPFCSYSNQRKTTRCVARINILRASLIVQLALTHVVKSANSLSLSFMQAISVSSHDDAPIVAVVQFNWYTIRIFDNKV